MIKDAALERFQKAMPQYPLRWTTSLGDFSGREWAIEVFGVDVKEQRSFLQEIREVRREIEKEFGHAFLFIFRDKKYLTPDPLQGNRKPEELIDHRLSGLIRVAADAAENDGCINELEEGILNHLADLLQGKSLEDVEQWIKTGR